MVGVVFLIHLKRVGFGTGSQLAAWKQKTKKLKRGLHGKSARAKGPQGEPQPWADKLVVSLIRIAL